MLFVMCICLCASQSCIWDRVVKNFDSYIWSTTVRAPTNLRLVEIDVNPRMAQRPAAAVTRDGSFVYPPNRLLVDQLYGCPRLRLTDSLAGTVDAVERRTWYSTMVCSNLGPVMASSLGI